MHERGGVLDVHLMVERPEHRVAEFAAAGADTLIVHAEATPNVHYALMAVRDAGLHAGLAINPGTPPEAVVGLVEAFDHLLCMTVNPGWGGQTYIDTSTVKVARLRELLGPGVPIEVDGGIDAATAGPAASRGRDAVRGGLLDLRRRRPGAGVLRDRRGRGRRQGIAPARQERAHPPGPGAGGRAIDRPSP